MKVGTITFHWAANYGAVLQAYALQRFLKEKDFDTEIIDYVPYRVKYRRVLSDIKRGDSKNLVKEYRINKFRKRYLAFSKKKVFNNSGLHKMGQQYDAVICGSDQVWNEWFVLESEKEINLSFYLNFVKDSSTRISYATSFGTDKLSDKVKAVVKPELKKYKSISVRENTGKDIIEDLGLSAQVVLDPTLFLTRENYEQIINDTKHKLDFPLFSYVLHLNQNKAKKIVDYVHSKYYDAQTEKKYDGQPIGIGQWLYGIKNAKYVVTNSFHGVIFSLIFNTPFIVIPVEGSGMNDRITTLLSKVNLQEHIVNSFDKDNIDNLINKKIDWENVDAKLSEMKLESIDFLLNSLSE